MSQVKTNQARIRRLETALAQIERKGKACAKAYERWGTDALAAELTRLREAWTTYNAELRTERAFRQDNDTLDAQERAV